MMTEKLKLFMEKIIHKQNFSLFLQARDLCGESYQCRFDYGMSLHRDMAHFTRNYYDSAVNIAKNNRE